MTIDWGIIIKSMPLLGHGVVVTLQVSALASVLGLMLGVVLGCAHCRIADPFVGLLLDMLILYEVHRYLSKFF